MQGAGDVVGEASGGSADYIALSYHGFTVTHIDALCHVMYKGRLYNGFPSSMVTSRGALRGAINTAEHGLSGRGVLLDVPAALGRDWLEPGEAILPEDLDQAEEHARLRVGPGDIVFVRTGRHARLAAGHPLPPRPSETPGPGNIRPFAGLHHTTLAWFNQRRIAVLGGDGFSDVVPAAPHPGAFAFHAVGIPAMGLHLIDNANLEQVRTACQDRNRYEFFLTIAPLRIHGGTGSPINPIAHF
jgi:kynurenine formamidase